MKRSNLNVQKIIELLNLQPLDAEGGMFRQAYQSKDKISIDYLPKGFSKQVHPFGTAIFYLLTSDEDSFSAMHRLPGDEVYHFYLGDPVEMLNLFPDGSSKRLTLGQDLLAGQQVLYVCPGGTWQGCRLISGGEYALLGTTMAPGFIESDYLGGNRDELVRRYPDQTEMITVLTREHGAVRMQ